MQGTDKINGDFHKIIKKLANNQKIEALKSLLKELDPVAYVRFASVYRNFKEEKDFVQFVDRLDVYKNK